MEDRHPDPEGKEAPARTSFWKTLPGVITAVAALVTALATLLAAADKAGIFSGGGEPPQERNAAGGSVTTTGDNSPVVQNTDGDVTIDNSQ